MSRLRLAQPATPPVLRPLEDFDVHRHNEELRGKWAAAVTWLRSRPGGSKFILDKQVERK